MPKRPFQPRPEGLEARQLLSTVGQPTAQISSVNTTQTAQQSQLESQRSQRIDRLANQLSSVRSGRVVPASIVANLQNDLRGLQNTLLSPPSYSLAAFNQQLRPLLRSSSLSQANAAAINDIFGKVLLKTGLSTNQILQYQSHMQDLTRFNVRFSRASSLVAGDYALMMQMTLGIGIKRS